MGRYWFCVHVCVCVCVYVCVCVLSEAKDKGGVGASSKKEAASGHW